MFGHKHQTRTQDQKGNGYNKDNLDQLLHMSTLVLGHSLNEFIEFLQSDETRKANNKDKVTAKNKLQKTIFKLELTIDTFDRFLNAIDSPHKKHLSILDLSASTFRIDQLEKFVEILNRRRQRLKHVILSSNQINSNVITYLAGLKHVEEIDIKDSIINSNGKVASEQTLRIKLNKLEDVDKFLAELSIKQFHPKITELDLSGSTFNIGQMSRLVSILNKDRQNIRKLKLKSCAIDDGLAVPLEYLEKVESLSLEKNNITNTTIFNKNITSLYLDGNSKLDLSSQRFQHGFSPKRLGLRGCALTNASLKNLSTLSNLVWLDISDNSGIDDLGVNDTLINFKHLKKLHATDCQISKTGFKVLSENRPKLIIVSRKNAVHYASDSEAMPRNKIKKRPEIRTIIPITTATPTRRRPEMFFGMNNNQGSPSVAAVNKSRRQRSNSR